MSVVLKKRGARGAARRRAGRPCGASQQLQCALLSARTYWIPAASAAGRAPLGSGISQLRAVNSHRWPLGFASGTSHLSLHFITHYLGNLARALPAAPCQDRPAQTFPGQDTAPRAISHGTHPMGIINGLWSSAARPLLLLLLGSEDPDSDLLSAASPPALLMRALASAAVPPPRRPGPGPRGRPGREGGRSGGGGGGGGGPLPASRPSCATTPGRWRPRPFPPPRGGARRGERGRGWVGAGPRPRPPPPPPAAASALWGRPPCPLPPAPLEGPHYVFLVHGWLGNEQEMAYLETAPAGGGHGERGEAAGEGQGGCGRRGERHRPGRRRAQGNLQQRQDHRRHRRGGDPPRRGGGGVHRRGRPAEEEGEGRPRLKIRIRPARRDGVLRRQLARGGCIRATPSLPAPVGAARARRPLL